VIPVFSHLGGRGLDLDQPVDTGTPAGPMLFHVLAAIAESSMT